MDTINQTTIQAQTRAFDWPTDNQQDRVPQATHFVKLMEWFDTPLVKAYLDGAQSTEAVRATAFSPGAARQTVGFIRHQLDTYLGLVQARLEAIEDAQSKKTKKKKRRPALSTSLPAAIDGDERTMIDKLLTALDREAADYDAHLLKLQRAGEPVPPYWSRP